MGKDGRQLIVIALLPVLCALAFARCGNPLVLQIVEPKTVRFDSNGGTDIASQTLYKNQTIKPPSDPSKDGHEFEGWFRDNETFEAAWDFKTVPIKNITLYAKWEALPVIEMFTVMFDKNGGDTDADPVSVTVEEGSLITAPETAPVRAWFNFSGWYREADGVTQWDFAVDTVTEDLTLYARWEAKKIGEFTVEISIADIAGMDIELIASGLALSRTDGTPAAITVQDADAYTVEWYYNNSPLGTGATVTLAVSADPEEEAAYTAPYNIIGKHRLTVIVTKDGLPFSKYIEFEVKE